MNSYRSATLLFILFSQSVFSQVKKETIMFYELIEKDSAQLFVTMNYSLTSRECAEIIRYTRVSADGNFTGNFFDISLGTTIASGSYSNGMKVGGFETFYKTGKMEIEGFYQNNKPRGKWTYYLENGVKERQIEFEDSTATIVFQLSKKGDILVELGNGSFDGEVEVAHVGKGLLAKGHVKNGRPDGKWRVSLPTGHEYFSEIFSNGKFVKRSLNSSFKLPNVSSTESIIAFTPYPNFVSLEKLHMLPCDLVTAGEYKVAKLKPMSDFRPRVLEELKQKYHNNGISHLEDIKIKFDIDESGIPKDFQVQSTPSPLTSRLISMIRDRARWEPALKNGKPQSQTQYFIVNYIDNGFGFAYRFGFTN